MSCVSGPTPRPRGIDVNAAGDCAWAGDAAASAIATTTKRRPDTTHSSVRTISQGAHVDRCLASGSRRMEASGAGRSHAGASLGLIRRAHRSLVSATAGATCDARHAGTQTATVAHATSTPTATATDTGSVAGTSCSCDCSARAASHVAGAPITMPNATIRNPSPNTRRNTWPRLAPRALRKPISPVRRVTAYDMTPYNPTAASTRAATPKPNDKLTTRRSWRIDSRMRTDSGSTATMGSSGSTEAMAARTAPTRRTGSPRVRTSSDIDGCGASVICCAYGVYARRAGGAPNEWSRTSAMTPTTVDGTFGSK